MQQDSGEESWFEEQCHRDINTQNEESEREYLRNRDSSLTQVWGAFQDSATAVAQLYRERSSNSYPDTGALWLPFQTAAGTVTTLYKESCDGIKRSSETAQQSGYQKRTRELAEWARSKKRRMIRREDLLAYLAGKPLPPLSNTHNNRRSPKPEHHAMPNNNNNNNNNNNSNHSPNSNMFNSNLATVPHHHHQNHNQHHHHPANHHHHHPHHNTNSTTTAAATNTNDDLHTFKEALVLRPRGPELFAFVANEIARHCKRPASPLDDKMDVCHYSSKRQRFM